MRQDFKGHDDEHPKMLVFQLESIDSQACLLNAPIPKSAPIYEFYGLDPISIPVLT